MEKIAIGAILTLLGVIGAGVVTYFIQNRQFKHDKDYKNNINKSLLKTLIQEIENVYKELMKINNDPNNFNKSIGTYEYFDEYIQKAIIDKLMGTKLFYQNYDIFNRVIQLIPHLLALNEMIRSYHYLLLSGASDAGPQSLLTNNRNDAINYIKKIIHFINQNNNDSAQCMLIEELKNIKVD